MLKVGIPTAFNAVLTNLTVILVTAAVGLFGTSALAGYGIASRLDYIMIPLLFGISTATLTMVGVNMGAGQTARARAGSGGSAACVGMIMTGTIGLLVAIFPTAWLNLFSHDAEVVNEGMTYLRSRRAGLCRARLRLRHLLRRPGRRPCHGAAGVRGRADPDRGRRRLDRGGELRRAEWRGSRRWWQCRSPPTP